jgi:hypothetical protein
MGQGTRGEGGSFTLSGTHSMEGGVGLFNGGFRDEGSSDSELRKVIGSLKERAPYYSSPAALRADGVVVVAW